MIDANRCYVDTTNSDAEHGYVGNESTVATFPDKSDPVAGCYVSPSADRMAAS